MFTATRLQAVTYLLGVCLFSIAFLVFLNSSVSFVITDLIGQRTRVGDAVGTLGFADELVVLIACPTWGVISDRLGVRVVSQLITENVELAQLWLRSASWAMLLSVLHYYFSFKPKMSIPNCCSPGCSSALEGQRPQLWSQQFSLP